MELIQAMQNLRNAVDFLDICRKDATASETGALKDAREWIEDAARKVLAATPSS